MCPLVPVPDGSTNVVFVLKQVNRLTNRHGGKLLLAGMGMAAFYNWQLWQRDKALLVQKVQPTPLPPLETWPELPKVTVLVAAWNEENNIDRHIQSFLTLRYPCKELVLCAGGLDRTFEIAARYGCSQVIVLEQQEDEGKQRALARSLPHATGQIIFFTDADCELSDPVFERTLLPVALKQEPACAGSSQPSLKQADHPFVFSQAASQLYANLHTLTYAPGLLGRNFAVQRQVLEQSCGLHEPAPTGTDYVLAKMLTKAGVRIRQEPQSRIITKHPTNIEGYLRQQRRWLRNVFLYGRKYGAADEVQASVRTSAIGAVMLAAPLLFPLIGEFLVVPWLILFAHGLLSRLRYLLSVSILLSFPLTWKHVAVLPVMLTLDFVAWAGALVEYMVTASHSRW